MSQADESLKSAIVTGAGSGIGQATAKRLASDGFAVICFDLRGAAATAEAIVAAGHKAASYEGDVSNPDDWTRVVELAETTFGPVQALANIAGICPGGDSIATNTTEFMDRIIQVNLMGTIFGMRAVLPGMVARRSGKIINTSSLSAVNGYPALGAYSASKGAVDAVTRQAAKEYGGKGICINAISPGSVATAMHANHGDTVKKILEERGDDAAATPDQPAGIFSFMASPASDYLNGIIVRCGN